MQTKLLEDFRPYDGRQLTAHWIRRTAGIAGDALVAFEGPADVPTDHMVDIEDVLADAPIASAHMLHFLAEWFIDSLDQGILLQHLFAAEAYGLLWEKGVRGLSKRGNDLFLDGRKLSVSIATRSGVSVLMHTAFNVRTDGTPIPTAGLEEMGISPREFAGDLLELYACQFRIWQRARAKVSPRL